MSNRDTIAAISTSTGRAAIGIIRISGRNVKKIMKRYLCDLKPRYATYTRFKDNHKINIDSVIAIYYPNPSSYTGEDLLEIHSHGNPIILDKIVTVVCENFARHAKPGEFTERAFLNDKIDLLQAEATIDLINSSSLYATKSAVNSLSGNYSSKINSLKKELLNLRTSIEASINFPEDEVDSSSDDEMNISLNKITDDTRKILDTTNKGILLNSKIIVSIVGLPNSGKSSLCNYLLREQKSIVTNTPGTTRDVINYELKCGQNIISLHDTAGLRETDDEAEKKGIELAYKTIKQSTIVLYIIDSQKGKNDKDTEILSEELTDKDVWVVMNKIDLTTAKPKVISEDEMKVFYVSSLTGQGIELLEQELSQIHSFHEENITTARVRHQQKLGEVLQNLYNAEMYSKNNEHDFIAQELAVAHKKLDEITGGDHNDEVLESIFSEFCIGK